MNAPNAQNSAAHHASGMSLDDILFIVFRHKRLIFIFFVLGVLAAGTVRFVHPPKYLSVAKIQIHYVMDSSPSGASGTGPEAAPVRRLEIDPQSILASEIEILKSFDVAVQTAEMVGPERILASSGGGTNRLIAATVVASGIQVDPPKSAILTVSFKHPDPQLVKPVLDALIQCYIRKHLDVHERPGAIDDDDSKLKDDLRRKLQITEEELRKLKVQAKVLVSVDETKRSYQTQISNIESELQSARRDLKERQALLGGANQLPNATNQLNGVPPEALGDYEFVRSQLDSLRARERELRLSFTDAYPLVQTLKSQIDKLTVQKVDMERAFPTLASLALSRLTSTNGTSAGPGAEIGEITRLNARIAALSNDLSNLQADAAMLLEMEPRLNEVSHRRDEAERNYNAVMRSIESRHIAQSSVAGKAINMSMVQEPTPPGLDLRKMMKLIGGVFCGFLALGFGIAFVKELLIDRSLKRSVDIQRYLHMPVFLTIPDTSWRDVASVGWLSRFMGSRGKARTPSPSEGTTSAQTGVAPWDPSHALRNHAEGLRERVMTYFEVNNLNLKKPKLVAVTGCAEGSGVSTLASSLASSLSETGDGNVLLVDMNGDQGLAHSFYKGKPGCGLAQVLEPADRDQALVQDNLYMASIEEEQKNDKLAMALPKHFNHLVPKLKASDYDYIIFDMPPVTPRSATPRLASHMDIVLLVLEAEKTRQHSASKAASLMRESRANVAAVLNKYREHLPASLAQE
jgi:polysaccharide biosynthesis transport protein